MDYSLGISIRIRIGGTSIESRRLSNPVVVVCWLVVTCNADHVGSETVGGVKIEANSFSTIVVVFDPLLYVLSCSVELFVFLFLLLPA